jgi:hypothetical protein
MLADSQDDHAILDLCRQDVINIQRVPDVLKGWEEPSFPDLARISHTR